MWKSKSVTPLCKTCVITLYQCTNSAANTLMLASVSGPLKQLLHLDYTELTSATNASFLLGTTCEKQQTWRIAKPDSPENVQGSLVKRAYSKAKVTKPSSPKFKQQLMAGTMGQTMLFNTTINLTSSPRPFWRSTASCHFHQHHSLRNTIIISAITRLTMQWFVVTSLYSRSISHFWIYDFST